MKKPKIDRNRICIIAGMPRAGTTFLYHALANNPSIFMPSRKETDFFSVNYYRGIDWYLNFFRKMRGNQIAFDISPIYFMDDDSPERIVRFNPDVKLVLIVRQPVEWVLSFYNHLQAKQYTKIDFNSFLDGHVYKKDSKELLLEFKANKVISVVKKYCEVYGKNLLLCDYKLFNRDPLSVMKSIEKFSGACGFLQKNKFKNERVNASADEPLKIINILMQQRLFADLVTKLFPKKVIMAIRYKLQASSDNTSLVGTEDIVSKENRELAGRRLGEAVEFVRDLFEEFGIMTGDGRRYDWN